jgi:hypothetical protein
MYFVQGTYGILVTKIRNNLRIHHKHESVFVVNLNPTPVSILLLIAHVAKCSCTVDVLKG